MVVFHNNVESFSHCTCWQLRTQQEASFLISSNFSGYLKIEFLSPPVRNPWSGTGWYGHLELNWIASVKLKQSPFEIWDIEEVMEKFANGVSLSMQFPRSLYRYIQPRMSQFWLRHLCWFDKTHKSNGKFFNLPRAFAQTVHFIYNSNVIIILGGVKYVFFHRCTILLQHVYVHNSAILMRKYFQAFEHHSCISNKTY